MTSSRNLFRGGIVLLAAVFGLLVYSNYTEHDEEVQLSALLVADARLMQLQSEIVREIYLLDSGYKLNFQQLVEEKKQFSETLETVARLAGSSAASDVEELRTLSRFKFRKVEEFKSAWSNLRNSRAAILRSLSDIGSMQVAGQRIVQANALAELRQRLFISSSPDLELASLQKLSAQFPCRPPGRSFP